MTHMAFHSLVYAERYLPYHFSIGRMILKKLTSENGDYAKPQLAAHQNGQQSYLKYALVMKLNNWLKCLEGLMSEKSLQKCTKDVGTKSTSAQRRENRYYTRAIYMDNDLHKSGICFD